jgi:hypothetical protein
VLGGSPQVASSSTMQKPGQKDPAAWGYDTRLVPPPGTFAPVEVHPLSLSH